MIGDERLKLERIVVFRGYRLRFDREKTRERVEAAAYVLQSRDSDDVFGDEVEHAVQELRSSFGKVLELHL